jgi:hypothetical protein
MGSAGTAPLCASMFRSELRATARHDPVATCCFGRPFRLAGPPPEVGTSRAAGTSSGLRRKHTRALSSAPASRTTSTAGTSIRRSPHGSLGTRQMQGICGYVFVEFPISSTGGLAF